MGKEGKEKKEKKDKEDKKEKKEKKDKEDKKEKKEKEEKKEKKEKKDKEDKKEKKEEKEDTKEKEEDKEVKEKEKEKNEKEKERRGSQVSRKPSTASVAASGTGGEVIPFTPTILQSDDERAGKFMVKVSLEDGSAVIEGPATVYGWTEDEVRLAALLRREQMRQRHFDKIPLREFIRPQDADRAGDFCHADFFDPNLGTSPGEPRPYYADGRGGHYRPYPGSPQRNHLAQPGRDTSHPPLDRYGRPGYSHSPARDAYSPSQAGSSDVSEGMGRGGALRAAAACGDTPGVLQLLRGGYLPVNEARPGDGRTALHHAARYGHVDVVDVLLEAGADPRQADAKHRSPLDYARQYGQREAARKMEAYRPPAAASHAGSPTGRQQWNPISDRGGAGGVRPYSPYNAAAASRPAMSGVEARRRLTQDVQQGMSGMTSMVRSWIHDWPEDDLLRAESPPHAAPRPYSDAGQGFPAHPGVRAYAPPGHPRPAPVPDVRAASPPAPRAFPRVSPSSSVGYSGYAAPAPSRGYTAYHAPSQQPPYPATSRPYGEPGERQVSPTRPRPAAASASVPPAAAAPSGRILDELTAKIWAASGNGGGAPPAAHRNQSASPMQASQDRAHASPGNSFLLPTDSVDI